MHTPTAPFVAHIPPHGQDGVVAIEPAGPFMRLFMRSQTGITFHDYPFTPFLLLESRELITATGMPLEFRELHGNGNLRWLALFQTWQHWCQVRDILQKTASPGAWYALADMRQQFLVISGIHLFQGLAFAQIRPFCLAVEAGDACQGPASSAIQRISLSNGSDYHAVFDRNQMDEREMLQQLTAALHDQDPDLLIGCNLGQQLLPLLAKRARQLGLQLNWGRNHSELRRLEQTDGGTRYEIYGRSIIELLELVRQLHRYLQPMEALQLAEASPLVEDVVLTRTANAETSAHLYQLLAPAWFAVARQFPTTLQAAVNKPMAAALNAHLIQGYLAHQTAVPSPPEQFQTATPEIGQVFQHGTVRPVAHCDLSSLSPSIMQAYRIGPRRDELQLFQNLLGQLLADPTPLSTTLPAIAAKLHLKLLYSAFSNLLERHGPFADRPAAYEATRLTAVITRDILHWLHDHGAVPVAQDQQGIFFIPPAGQTAEAEVQALMQQLATILPRCFTLRCDGQYQALFSYHAGSSALLQLNGVIAFRGSAIVARSMEQYLRDFLTEAIALLLTDKADEVSSLFEQYLRRLATHNHPVSWITRRETLTDSLEHYLQAVASGKRKHAAVYELALKAPAAWQRGDCIEYYITGNAKQINLHEHCKPARDFDPRRPDNNIAWYGERLRLLYQRLQPFLPPERTLFT